MANEVYANNMEVSCKAASGKSICAFPDVCMTPPQTPATPPGVPIPYPNTGMSSDMTDGSRTVKISGKEVMLKNKSYFKRSTGDEAGCAPKKGLVTSKNMGKVYFTMWSMDVKAEGENVVRHMDLTTHNHGSPPNTGPWPFASKTAVGPGGKCNKESKALVGKCSDPVNEDTSPGCCACPERQCVLVSFDNSDAQCCKSGRQTAEYKTTGHHPLPVAEVCHTRSEKKATKGRRAAPLAGNGEYHDGDAPTICVKGTYHRSRWSTGELMEHGLHGNAYVAELNAQLAAGNPKNYETISNAAAVATEKETGGTCSAECIKAQLDRYHKKKIKKIRQENTQKTHKPYESPRKLKKTGKKKRV